MPYTTGGTGFRPADTSLDAAERIEPSTATYRALCMDALRRRGPMTADEVAEHLGTSVLTIRPRMTELRQAGRIRDTGARRANVSGRMAAVFTVNTEPKEDPHV